MSSRKPSHEITFELPVTLKTVMTVAYDSKNTKDIIGIATDGDAKHGICFSVSIKHNKFELELLYIKWDDGLRDIYPQFRKGGDHFQTLHGRLRMSLTPIHQGMYRGKYYLALKTALLKKGITPHANLFGTTFSELDTITGLSVEGTLYEYGALNVGSKEDVFSDIGRSRYQNCAVFAANNYDVPILAFILTRVYPIYRKKYVS